MINIFLFLLILSIIFTSKYLFEFFYKFTQTNPEPLKITKEERIFLYLSISYIITYILR